MYSFKSICLDMKILCRYTYYKSLIYFRTEAYIVMYYMNSINHSTIYFNRIEIEFPSFYRLRRIQLVVRNCRCVL